MHVEITRRINNLEDSQFGLLLVLPLILSISLIFVFPTLMGIWFSLNNVSIYTVESDFIFLDHYLALVDNPDFHTAIWNSFIYTIGSVILSVIIGTATALLINQLLFARRFFGGLMLLPYLIPTVGTVFIFRWIFNGTNGVFNYILISVGAINAPIAWLSEIQFAMASLITISGWRLYPFVTLLVLARLQTIPKDHYEAANLMGASIFAKFRHITLPQLRNVLFVAILFRTLWTFNLFDIIWLGTGGGPARRTETLPIMAYRIAFRQQDLGIGSAVAVVAFLILMAGTVIYFRKYGESNNE